VYTHYDLNANNAMLYKPYLGYKYIEMHYHFSDGEIITFPTEYIVKIIDYARNYFNNKDDKIDSQLLFDKFCANYKAPACMSTKKTNDGYASFDVCGKSGGIQTGEYTTGFGKFHYITPNKKNISHDLLLASNTNYIDALAYYLGLQSPIFLEYKLEFGTPPLTNREFMKSNYAIATVDNMLDFLKNTIRQWNHEKFRGWTDKKLSEQEKYNKYASPTWTKMGDMHIYEDMRPYEFTTYVEQVKNVEQAKNAKKGRKAKNV
jgi:hypothetical protein